MCRNGWIISMGLFESSLYNSSIPSTEKTMSRSSLLLLFFLSSSEGRPVLRWMEQPSLTSKAERFRIKFNGTVNISDKKLRAHFFNPGIDSRVHNEYFMSVILPVCNNSAVGGVSSSSLPAQK